MRMESLFYRWDIVKIYLVVGAGFLLLTASFYFFGFRPLTERLDSEHAQKIEYFLESGKWLLESALDRHVSLVKQSASRTAIRNKQGAYLRGDVSLDELITFSVPKLNDAVKADLDIVGITSYDPDGRYLYHVGLQVTDEIAALCDFSNLNEIRQLRPILMEGKRRLVYCSPIWDKDRPSGNIGYDALLLEEGSLQAIMDTGDEGNINIMSLFVTDQSQDILFKPKQTESFLPLTTVQEHLTSGVKLAGYITRTAPLSNSQWRVHAVVNEKLFFADIRHHLVVLTSVTVLVMVVIFICTVLVLRLIIRTLLKEAELLEMSHRDGLTGLYNHKYMHEQLDRELARSQRNGRGLCVVMLDLDHFKEVNDKHGHQAGDVVLRRIATLIKDCIRSTDMAARYGGEEFMLILPDADKKGTLLTAERLRNMVEQEVVHTHSADISVTISLGIVCHSAKTDYMNGQDIVRAADKALYESKHYGRNQTTVTDGPLPVS